MSNKAFLYLAGILVLALTLKSSFFVVDQTQQALVFRLSAVDREVDEPGLKFKIPLIEDVVFYEKRLLEFNAEPEEVITNDVELGITERVVIDAYVRYRIVDPLRFFQAVRTVPNLNNRLSSVVRSSIRNTISEVSLRDLLSDRRSEIMQRIANEVNRKAAGEQLATMVEDGAAIEQPEVPIPDRGFGIEVVDVRIMRADLPADISQSTFQRMQANFQKEAAKFRAEGEERALKIRAEADRERTEILAEAEKKSETIRGEGDGTATKIYADAFNRDKDFFDFYRSMQAYRKTIGKDDTTMILSPDSEFLKHLNQSRP